jgi:mono/diheme cytochrome c family protein
VSVSDDQGLERSLHRWRVAGVVVFLLLVIAFPLYRSAEAGGRADSTTVRRSKLLEIGKVVWTDSCALCHGDQGQGVDSPALNSREFQEAATAEQIIGLVKVGVPGTNMQSWSDELGGPITDEQIEAVAAFIKAWGPDAPDVPDWRTKFLGTPPPMPAQMTHTHASGTASPAPSPTATPSLTTSQGG